jgi:hypothetical protein
LKIKYGFNDRTSKIIKPLEKMDYQDFGPFSIMKQNSYYQRQKRTQTEEEYMDISNKEFEQ